MKEENELNTKEVRNGVKIFLMENFLTSCLVNWVKAQSLLLVRIKSST